MKTLTGKHSLLLWKQNSNMTNILLSVSDVTADDFVKSHIKTFFEELKHRFETKKAYSFCYEWQKLSETFYNDLAKEIKDFFKCDDFSAERVSNKVRGNIGEIFAELFFTNCGNKWFASATYEPVDPTNERFTDASAMDILGKVKCGIQVKNYTGEIPSKVFWKASFEDDLAIRKLSADLREFYLKKKRQFIFSFTEEKFSPNTEDYKLVVEMIGPEEIDRELKDNNFRLDLLEKLLSNF